MDYNEISISQIDMLWKLQKAYKAAIKEDEPAQQARDRLMQAMEKKQILFYGAWDGATLAGCCPVTAGFSTFDYNPSGVLEDFYIFPEYRHRGIARKLVQFAHQKSNVSSLTVGCADCDMAMYQALGFNVVLGHLLAWGC